MYLAALHVVDAQKISFGPQLIQQSGVQQSHVPLADRASKTGRVLNLESHIEVRFFGWLLSCTNSQQPVVLACPSIKGRSVDAPESVSSVRFVQTQA